MTTPPDDDKSVVRLITAGERAHPDDIADALAMGEKDFRRTLAEIAPEGVDEIAWVTLLDPEVIHRTLLTLGAMCRGLADSVEADRRKRDVADLLSAVRARQAQVAWAQQRQRTIRVAEGRAHHERFTALQGRVRLTQVRDALNVLQVADLQTLGLGPNSGARAGIQAAVELVAAALVVAKADLDAAEGATP